mgnify:CR=1 FL=1
MSLYPDYAEVRCRALLLAPERPKRVPPSRSQTHPSPSPSQSIVDFRYRQLGAAKENAKQFGLAGSLYPWTGARFGNCTGIGPCAD